MNEPLAFGGVERPKDSRDWDLGSIAPSSPRPETYFTDISSLPVEMQKRLNVKQTGFFWTATRAAVKAYQAANNIPATGYVGILTRTSLNK